MMSPYQLRDDGVYEAAWWVWLPLFPTLLLSGSGVYRYWSEAGFRYGWFFALVVVLFVICYRGWRPRPIMCVKGGRLMLHPRWIGAPGLVALDHMKELSLRGPSEKRQLWCTDADGIERRLDNSLWSPGLIAHVERYFQSVKKQLPVPIQFHEPSSPYLS